MIFFDYIFEFVILCAPYIWSICRSTGTYSGWFLLVLSKEYFGESVYFVILQLATA